MNVPGNQPPQDAGVPSPPPTSPFAAPSISLPKGGGAIRGIGEKFAANPVTGTGSLTAPIPTSPGRSGFGPQLAISYDSGSGNGPFGWGWNLGLPSITRKTDKGLPQYFDAEESDVFVLSGAEDLVPTLIENPPGEWVREQLPLRALNGAEYRVDRYRPRIEGLFARIERWTNITDAADCCWRSISKGNLTTWYGKSAESRIADPDDPTHIFSWLICQSYDDKGNAIVYEYVGEDAAGVNVSAANERNRTRTANRYLKRIKYGNRPPNRDGDWVATNPSALTDWMFEVLFDYDEGHYQLLAANPEQQEFVACHLGATVPWSLRRDGFSSYRSGFEVRTSRLCRRVLMFHHFPEELLRQDCLVRSTDFGYEEGDVASFMTAVTQSGYVHLPSDGEPDRYLRKSLPPLQFEYSRVPTADELAEQPVHDVDAASVENLPYGPDGAAYQWVDLDGEGLSGLLTEQADGWFYKRNLSANNQIEEKDAVRTAARFGPVEVVASRPSIDLGRGQSQFIDLAGDGQVDLMVNENGVRGFYERTGADGWAPFHPFPSWPSVDMRDPNLKFVDLDGDGHVDILITEHEVLTWHPSLAESGFAPSRRVQKPDNEDDGPRLVFADGTDSVYLADLSGDGLTDLVRIRNGDVSYWPNCGYGRFGKKITMDNAPWFDAVDLFDQKRIRVADIDGSGTTDIIYLGHNQVDIYRNQSGNTWSAPHTLTAFPRTDNLSSVQAVDLLGNGTACLVWSSPLAGAAAQPMRYIDLMGGIKPHLLVRLTNNLGAETVVHYAPSTKFYLDDTLAGLPWATRLPFPVHVVERVETYDRVSGNRFVTRSKYRHGCFDGDEREFRGFGMVEQWDTGEVNVPAEQTSSVDTNLDSASFVPPVRTRTWFHTGVFLGRDRVSSQFAEEYHQEPGSASSSLLDDTPLPARLASDDERDACRALKGMMLRQEIYADDAPADAAEDIVQRAQRPYRVAEQNFTVRMLQPHGGNRHAVFLAHPNEELTHHYERAPEHPRISHTLTLDVDPYGNVLKSAAIGYGREASNLATAWDRGRQTRSLVTYTEHRFTNAVAAADSHAIPLAAEARTFELTGYEPTHVSGRYQPSDFVAFDAGTQQNVHLFDTELAYEAFPSSGRQRRLIEHVRTVFRRSALTGLSRLGDLDQAEPVGLPGETYKLAFTPLLLQNTYRRRLDGGPEQPLVPNPASVLGGTGADQGGYRSSQALRNAALFPPAPGDSLWTASDDDDHWWIPSGKVFYSPANDDAAAAELLAARGHFFLPHRFRDPFERVVTVTYDSDDDNAAANHNLLVTATRDALENTVAAAHDYRVLLPNLMTDPNGNQSAARFDALGMVAGTVVRGKANEGDSFIDFVVDLTPAQTAAYFDAVKPRALAIGHLGTATTRIIYDLARMPSCAASIARETHVSDLDDGEQAVVQLSFVYSDGFGREAQTKIQAEPGPLDPEDDASPHLDPRWVSSGAQIYNNKGKPVRKYEPFFSATHGYGIEQHGVSSRLFYDPPERVVATLHPDRTWEKVVFDPWQNATYDASDTVLGANGETDPTSDADVGGFFERLAPAEYLPTWYDERITAVPGDPDRIAAEKTAVHRQTPTVAHFDVLGRTFLTVAQNRFVRDGVTHEESYRARLDLDVEGNQRQVRDAMEQTAEPPGRAVMTYDYDMLGGRIHQASMDAGERWMLNDVMGKPIRTWDSRGFNRRMTYDELRRPTGLFVENGAERLAERTVYGESQGPATNHRTRVYQSFDAAGVVTSEAYDFKGNLLRSRRELLADYKADVDWQASPDTTAGTFESRTTFDALNRPTAAITADGSTHVPTYNEANLLDQVEVNIRGVMDANQDPVWTLFVANIDYNAKGQRTAIRYGNGAETSHAYDRRTFRLVRLRTTRTPPSNDLASQIFSEPATVQDLRYTYDASANITRIEDAALLTTFNNGEVRPVAEYTYDAIDRLIEASGREHIGQCALDLQPTGGNLRDRPFVGINAHPNDLHAIRGYTERYAYDAVGNFDVVRHIANGGSWTRSYEYDADSLIEPTVKNNRLTSTTVGNGSKAVESCGYVDAAGRDVDGCMTAINALALVWDCKDQLKTADLGGGGTGYYVYDASGERVRKVIETQDGRRKEERLYLGGYEIHREYDSSGTSPTLERETLHVMDDRRRIALVETKTVDQGSPIARPTSVQRCQLGNHLGSVCLELSGSGSLISFEEYHPYGTTAFQAIDSAAEVSVKRYRQTGKERDGETGLCYYGARFYACWLGRWISPDPAGLADGQNRYRHALCSPATLVDHTGLQTRSEDEIRRDLRHVAAEKDITQTKIGELQSRLERLEVTKHRARTETVPDKEARKFIKEAERETKRIQKEMTRLQKSVAKTQRQLVALQREALGSGVSPADILEEQGVQDPLSDRAEKEAAERAKAMEKIKGKKGPGSGSTGGSPGGAAPPGGAGPKGSANASSGQKGAPKVTAPTPSKPPAGTTGLVSKAKDATAFGKRATRMLGGPVGVIVLSPPSDPQHGESQVFGLFATWNMAVDAIDAMVTGPVVDPVAQGGTEGAGPGGPSGSEEEINEPSTGTWYEEQWNRWEVDQRK